MTPTQQSPTESIDQHTVDMSDRHSNETHTNKFSRQELPLWVHTERLCFTSHISASSWFYQLRSPQRRTQLAKPASLAGTKRRHIIPRGCWFYQLRSPQRRTQLANPASLAATNRRNIIPRGCEFLSHLCQFAIGRRNLYTCVMFVDTCWRKTLYMMAMLLACYYSHAWPKQRRREYAQFAHSLADLKLHMHCLRLYKTSFQNRILMPKRKNCICQA